MSNDEIVAERAAFVARMTAEPTDPAPDAPVAAEHPAPPDSAASDADADAAIDPDDAGDPAETPEPDDADEEEDDEEAETTPDAPDETPSAFAVEMRRLGIDLSLGDVPPAAQAAVVTKFKQLEAGFTKARQRDAGEVATLRAEVRFQTERPDDFIVSLLRKDAALADRVNAKLDELDGSPTAGEAHDIVVERAREKALVTERTAADEAADVDALEAHLQARLTAAGVTPGKALERMLADAATLAEKTSGRRALTRAVIDGIVDDYAADVTAARTTGARETTRERSRAYTHAKVTDRTVAGLKVRPGQGIAPAPAPEKPPTTDAEFKLRMLAKLA